MNKNVDKITENDRLLWQSFFESENAMVQARMKLFANVKDKVALMRYALQSAHQRTAALQILLWFPVEVRFELFPDLIDLASVAHADIGLVRDVILSLPHEWVIANIEKQAEYLLQPKNEEEYRRLLELYILLDDEMTLRLAQRAKKERNVDIHEAGERFLERLSDKQGSSKQVM